MRKSLDNKKSLIFLVEFFGSQNAIAKALKIRATSVSRWFKRGFVPIERVAELTELTGKSRKFFRSDIYCD
jgi:hypothetical protein